MQLSITQFFCVYPFSSYFYQINNPKINKHYFIGFSGRFNITQPEIQAYN